MTEVTRIAADDLPNHLEPIVRRRIEGAASASIVNWRPAAQGFSTETFLFYVVDVAGHDEPLGLVFRRPPVHDVLPDYDLSRQHLVMERLRDSVIPVPTTRWLDTTDTLGTPYFVMDRIDDVVLVSDVPPYHDAGVFGDASPAEREKLWNGCVDIIADLRSVDPTAHRLGFLDLGAFGSSAPQRLAGFLRYALHWAAAPGGPSPDLVRALDWLDDNLYEPEYVGLCWGDARMSNVLYDKDFGTVAALDWELAYLGDPACDLAWMFATDWISSPLPGRASAAGTPSREETMERYRRRTGLSLEHMQFCDVAAALLLAIPLLRLNTILALDVDLAEICAARIDHFLTQRHAPR